jgi:hypothetical protein
VASPAPEDAWSGSDRVFIGRTVRSGYGPISARRNAETRRCGLASCSSRSGSHRRYRCAIAAGTPSSALPRRGRRARSSTVCSGLVTSATQVRSASIPDRARRCHAARRRSDAAVGLSGAQGHTLMILVYTESSLIKGASGPSRKVRQIPIGLCADECASGCLGLGSRGTPLYPLWVIGECSVVIRAVGSRFSWPANSITGAWR